MAGIGIYFSNFFGVDEEILEEYGAVNISLINDLPLFIDPFLLFNSEDKKLRDIHDEMISYLKFLQIESERVSFLSDGMMRAWYHFQEVKQTWLGFSMDGNSGRGLGADFARGLYDGLSSIFKSFGRETITQAAHMEKLCLISPNVGRDKISDFTTNFAKPYLLEYTETFARKYLQPDQCCNVAVPRVVFNYRTKRWMPKTYYLPMFNGDYVVLTPKVILTRDETFINRTDMLRKLEQIAPSISDEELRFSLNRYFSEYFDENTKVTQKNKENAADLFIKTHPEVIDYYLRYKEEHKDEATSVSKAQVMQVQQLFIDQLPSLVELLKNTTDFYSVNPDAHDEAMKRLQFMKHVIEDQDGYRYFYIDGKPVRKETDLQIMFRLVWYGSDMDVNREVNNGRGPVDYKISYGKANATLVEFKLASNGKLKQNLAKQVDVYKAASDTSRAIKAILYFTAEELEKVVCILNELEIAGCHDIVLIDGRQDNKPSASNVKMEE